MAAFATAGRRGADKMEDRHFVAPRLGGDPHVHLVGVFDGHRGAEAADFCARQLTQHLAASWQNQPTLEGALAAAFVSVDAAFCAAEQQVRIQGFGCKFQAAGADSRLRVQIYGCGPLTRSQGPQGCRYARHGPAVLAVPNTLTIVRDRHGLPYEATGGCCSRQDKPYLHDIWTHGRAYDPEIYVKGIANL
eukprot:1182436-Prorocentrum_minimum.AAC.3